ncbi:hypothetical protein [Vibrio taketomensis]|uniref:hypothetical protein n=1 Tax=Vibrio taketomensis TaxID=2572923 RepID=UPI0039E9B42B
MHAVDQHGKVLLHKSVTRSKLLTTIANMPPMRIGVEAWWCTLLGENTTKTRSRCSYHGGEICHTISNQRKNDLNDAVAICEAVQRPTTRFVPIKSPSNKLSYRFIE